MLEQDMVTQFHRKNNYPINERLIWDSYRHPKNNRCLIWLGKFIRFIVNRLQKRACIRQRKGDQRLYRILLILEEVGETSEALGYGDEVETADGLTDLLYVTYGTGVGYCIPLHECFKEVHRANMSKKKRAKNDPRMRDKGSWTPPDLRPIIDSYKDLHPRGIDITVKNMFNNLKFFRDTENPTSL